MQVIDKTKILLNAYTASDMSVASGVLEIANTPVSEKWKDVEDVKRETYAAGTLGDATIEFDDSGAINYDPSSPVRVVLRNTKTGTELPIVIYADSVPTDVEIAAQYATQLGVYGNISDFMFVSNVAEAVKVELNDGEYSDIFVETNVAGLSVADGTITLTPAVKAVGAGDAANLAGYNPATQYDKYTIDVKGVLDVNGHGGAVIHRHGVYVDNSLGDFASDWADVIAQGGVAAVGDLTPYTAVD